MGSYEWDEIVADALQRCNLQSVGRGSTVLGESPITGSDLHCLQNQWTSGELLLLVCKR